MWNFDKKIPCHARNCWPHFRAKRSKVKVTRANWIFELVTHYYWHHWHIRSAVEMLTMGFQECDCGIFPTQQLYSKTHAWVFLCILSIPHTPVLSSSPLEPSITPSLQAKNLSFPQILSTIDSWHPADRLSRIPFQPVLLLDGFFFSVSLFFVFLATCGRLRPLFDLAKPVPDWNRKRFQFHSYNRMA